jgi:hypothetical protein
MAAQQAQKAQVQTKSFLKIGMPGYQVSLSLPFPPSFVQVLMRVLFTRVQVTKVRDPITGQLGLLFQVHYPEIKDGVKPRHRFMSSFEQKVEVPDRNWQYLLVSLSSLAEFPQSFFFVILPFLVEVNSIADSYTVHVASDCGGTLSNYLVQDSIEGG